MFRHWTLLSLQKLQAFFIERVYIRGQAIYKVGDESDKVYLIKSGNCTLQNKVHEVVWEADTKKMRRSPSRRIKMTRTAEVAILEAGTMFGHEDAIAKRKR